MLTAKIYYLEHPETKQPFYVGCTSREIEFRLLDHICNSTYVGRLFIGKEKPTIHLIEEVAPSVSAKSECYWIHQFKAWGFKLINRNLNPSPINAFVPAKDNNGRYPIKRSISISRAIKRFKTSEHQLHVLITNRTIKRFRNYHTRFPLFCLYELTEYFKSQKTA